MEKKWCPFVYANVNMDSSCAREKCEWWYGDECSIKAIVKQLEEIAISLQEIAISLKVIARGHVDDE